MMMMILLGVGLIIGAVVDSVMTSFALSHLVIALLGIGLVIVNLLGRRLKLLKGIGRTLASLLLIGIAVWGINTVIQDEETQNIISLEELKVLEEQLDNGSYDVVIREGLNIARINPEDSQVYRMIGEAYRGKNDHIREIYYHKIAVGLAASSIKNRIGLAEAYGYSHSYEEAIEQYEIAKEYASTEEEKNMIYESYIRWVDAGAEVE